MNGEKKTYLYPKNMRSSKDGWGNFFVIAMDRGSKWLGYRDEEKNHRVMISTLAYEGLVRNAKENHRRFSEKGALQTNK